MGIDCYWILLQKIINIPVINNLIEEISLNDQMECANIIFSSPRISTIQLKIVHDLSCISKSIMVLKTLRI